MNVKETALSVFNSTRAKVDKYSPELCLGLGIIAGIGGIVCAIKATHKAEDIVESHKEIVYTIHNTSVDEEYTEKQQKNDIVKAYVRTGVALTKVYAPTIALETVSIVSILASHNILNKRNAALAAAYTAIDNSFKDYRKNVVDRFGEEIDRQLKLGIKEEEIEETQVDSKGKEKIVKKTVETVPENESGYIKYFTRSNPNWCDDEDYITYFFNIQQAYCNDLLRSKGKRGLTLNEVYEVLGFERTKAGMVVGWIYDRQQPTGDNKVEFQVTKVHIPNENGIMEPAYAVDFNVDGNIYDLVV